jgi:hypothetical protein
VSLKFYAGERKRWPQLAAKCDLRYYDEKSAVVEVYRVDGLPASTSRPWCRRRWEALGRMGAEEAELGIRRLAAKFGLSLRGVNIRFTSGNRHSKAGHDSIVLNLGWASWLVIAHEVGHNYVFRKLRRSQEGRRMHSRKLNELVDKFCAWIAEQGWHQGALAHEIAVKEVARARLDAEREHLAALPEPAGARVARRRMQVKRLETKIRSLTTRLKRAKRSLAAMERSAARVAEAATAAS